MDIQDCYGGHDALRCIVNDTVVAVIVVDVVVLVLDWNQSPKEREANLL
jgi:hypothetical protein